MSRESKPSILESKNYITIHYNDERRFEQFLEAWREILKLKFKGVHPLVANEFQRLGIAIDFISEEQICLLFEDIIKKNHISNEILSMATISSELRDSFFHKSEVHVIERIYPTLIFKSCHSRGEFTGRLVYWGDSGIQKIKLFNVYSLEHNSYKEKFQRALIEIIGRLKEQQPQKVTASA